LKIAADAYTRLKVLATVSSTLQLLKKLLLCMELEVKQQRFLLGIVGLFWIESVIAEEGSVMKQKTNFDIYLEDQLKDPDFAARFKKAGEAWDVALQLAALRKDSGFWF